MAPAPKSDKEEKPKAPEGYVEAMAKLSRPFRSIEEAYNDKFDDKKNKKSFKEESKDKESEMIKQAKEHKEARKAQIEKEKVALFKKHPEYGAWNTSEKERRTKLAKEKKENRDADKKRKEEQLRNHTNYMNQMNLEVTEALACQARHAQLWAKVSKDMNEMNIKYALEVQNASSAAAAATSDDDDTKSTVSGMTDFSSVSHE